MTLGTRSFGPGGTPIEFKLLGPSDKIEELEEAVKGTSTTIKVPALASCEVCDGSGAAEGSSPITCNTCGGSGQVRMSVEVGDRAPVVFRTDAVGRAVGFEIWTEPGPADVTFVIEADQPAWRHFCFNAQVVAGE